MAESRQKSLSTVGARQFQPLRSSSRFVNEVSNDLKSPKSTVYSTMLRQEHYKDRVEGSKTKNRIHLGRSPESPNLLKMVPSSFVDYEKQYGRLLSRYQGSQDMYQQTISNLSHEGLVKDQIISGFKETLLRAGSIRNPNSGFKQNPTNFQMNKTADSENNHKTKLGKSVSASLIHNNEYRKGKDTPLGPEEKEDVVNKIPQALLSQCIKLQQELKVKVTEIIHLQAREQELKKKANEANKLEVEYYRLLNDSISAEESLRERDRNIQALEHKLRQTQQSVQSLQEGKSLLQAKLAGIKDSITRQEDQNLDQWRRMNRVMSESLIKLNHQNAIITDKSSQTERRVLALNDKLAESQKLVAALKFNAGLDRTFCQSLVSSHKKQCQAFKEAISVLEKQNSGLRTQITRSSQNLLVQQLTARLNHLQEQLDIKGQTIDTLNIKLLECSTGNSHQQITAQCNHNLHLQRASFQNMEAQYISTIRQHQHKIRILQNQIQSIKNITSQTEIQFEEAISVEMNQDQDVCCLCKAQKSMMSNQIQELKSRLEMIAIVESQLKDRLQSNAGRMYDIEQQRDQEATTSQAMVSTLKQRISLLEKEMVVMDILKLTKPQTDQNCLHTCIQQLKSKCRDMQELLSNLHQQKRELEQKLRVKEKLIGRLYSQVQNDQDVIKHLKGVLSQTGRNPIAHPELVDATNRNFVDRKNQSVNHRLDALDESGEGSYLLDVQMCQIYNKSDFMQLKIEEASQSEEQDNGSAGQPQPQPEQSC